MNFLKLCRDRLFFATISFALASGGVAYSQQEITSFDALKKLETTLTDMVPRVMPATVCLVGKDSGASGSGVIVNAEGLILTASHVIEGEEVMEVLFPDGKQHKARVLGANYTKDAAMIQLEPLESGEPWPFVSMGNSDEMQVGDFVVALGHSEGFDPLRTPPVRFGRVVSLNSTGFFSSDCTLIGGDSGGPLFNLKGEVVGIHSSIGLSAMANNHAGVNGFKADWEDLQSGRSWGNLSSNPLANPESPVIGFGIGGIRDGGVIVGRIFEGGPAAKAGILTGDLIWEIKGERVKEGTSLLIELSRQRPGQEIEMVVKRGDVLLDVVVTLERRGDFYNR